MEEELRVRYEDSELIVVDKPAGMHTAPLSPGDSGTLLELVMESFPEVGALPGIKAVEPGLVHRLDRETSGLVVVARTSGAFEALRRSFASGEARKDYAAACADAGPEACGTLRMESRFAPYGPGGQRVRVLLPGDEGGPRARSARKGPKGSPRLYQTEVQVLERQGSWALVRASLFRGFRHQVRAHLAHLGLPIAGDELYGVEAPSGAPERLYLHATALELAHPASGQELRLSSPLPPEFRLPPAGGGVGRD